MWTSENNWYKWRYGDSKDWFNRQTNEFLPFETSFSCGYNRHTKTFKEELLDAASSTVDYFGSDISILFSGGVDSELMLRTFLDIGIKPNVYIYRYEKDYNIYDVSYAVTICSMLGINYKIIDFNLEKFYDHDAERISELSQIDRPRALPYCKFIEDTDGVPLLGASDLTLMRQDSNYSIKGSWIVRCWEHDIGWSKFIQSINKPAVGEWFKWTPGLVMSYMNTQWCRDLVNDKYIGKLGVNSTKIIGYREVYPDMIHRKKQTGFEQVENQVLEFEKFLEKKYQGLPYRNNYDRSLDDFKLEISGNNYV
jgi:hypothetical protein